MSSTRRWNRYWNSQTEPHHAQNTEEFYQSYAEEMKLLLAGIRRDRVLEIGCGNGVLFEVLGFDKAASYRGVDLSQAMIADFQQRFPRASLAVHEGQSYQDAEEYDLVFSSAVTQYFSTKMLDEHLRRAKQMLAPDGHIVLASIPWRPARRAHRMGYLIGSQQAGLLRFCKASIRQTIHGLMGRWYSERDIVRLARKNGFGAVFHGSFHYPYRIHAVLTSDNQASRR